MNNAHTFIANLLILRMQEIVKAVKPYEQILAPTGAKPVCINIHIHDTPDEMFQNVFDSISETPKIWKSGTSDLFWVDSKYDLGHIKGEVTFFSETEKAKELYKSQGRE